MHTARFATIDALAEDSSGRQGKGGALALKPCRSRVSICPKHRVPLCYGDMKETFEADGKTQSQFDVEGCMSDSSAMVALAEVLTESGTLERRCWRVQQIQSAGIRALPPSGLVAWGSARREGYFTGESAR